MADNSVRYLTEKQVAKMLSCAVSTLRNQRHQGRGIPYSKFGRSVRYNLQDVITYMESRRIGTN